MINMVILILRLHGKLDAQAFENLDIHFRKHDRGMSLTAGESGKLLQCLTGCLVRCGGGGKSDQNLIGVQSAGCGFPDIRSSDSWIGSMAAGEITVVMSSVDTGQLF